jgi:hypothetical protein
LDLWGILVCSKCKADARSWRGLTYCCIDVERDVFDGSEHDFVVVADVEVESTNVPQIEACA